MSLYGSKQIALEESMKREINRLRSRIAELESQLETAQTLAGEALWKSDKVDELITDAYLRGLEDGKPKGETAK